jgi:hypothetical protein
MDPARKDVREDEVIPEGSVRSIRPTQKVRERASETEVSEYLGETSAAQLTPTQQARQEEGIPITGPYPDDATRRRVKNRAKRIAKQNSPARVKK